MDVYRQASEIINIVRAGHGTAKALCLRKEMQKKRQTYAVVCETLRHYELLEDVLAVSEFFKYHPEANKDFALCMAYDVVIGKGVSTKIDTTARAVQDSANYLRQAYWSVHRHHVVPPRTDDKFEEEAAAAEGGGDATRPAVLRLPRYARVNTLKIDAPTLISRLRTSAANQREEAAALEAGGGGVARKRGRGDDDGEGGEEGTGDKPNKKKGNRKRKILPDFTEDPIIPSLLVFPHGTDLHAHPAVRGGQLILQDRASCLPACILLDAVLVVKPDFPKVKRKKKVSKNAIAGSDDDDDENDEKKEDAERTETAGDDATKTKPLEYVIDACAAPGNKTTQLAALGAPNNIKLMAIERDERRAELLQRRVNTLGASEHTNVVRMDFFDMSSDDRAATEAILLDPSCSASGVVTRVDVALMHQKNHIRHNQQQQQRRRGEEEGSGNGGEGDATNTSSSNTAVVAEEYPAYGTEGEEDPAAPGHGSMNPADQGNEFAGNEARIEKLAQLQRKLLAHALLSFDACRSVVYSTCSVHETENEDVVRTVLSDTRVMERGWRLSNIMPGIWTTRGITRPDDTAPLDFTIRCDPAKDATNGFYVARFDRAL